MKVEGRLDGRVRVSVGKGVDGCRVEGGVLNKKQGNKEMLLAFMNIWTE